MPILGNIFNTRIGIANRTGEIATVSYFYQGEAAMLFMIGAKSTIIRTAIFDRGIEFKRHIPWFDKFQGLFVIVDIICNQYFLMPMGRTMLDKVNTLIPKDYFCFHLDQALGAYAIG
jgi:hypothetical protein